MASEATGFFPLNQDLGKLSNNQELDRVGVITEVILSMIKVALQQLRMPLLRGIQQKENRLSKREPYQCGPLTGIVYKDNFKNFFQMTMFFLAYVVTFLGQLHFTRNYFFTVNTSA